MGRYKCSAENCDSSSESDLKFFKFPLYNPRKLRRWLQSMRREDWAPDRFAVLCVRHFEEQHLDRTGKSVTLREEAVPTIFSPPAEGDRAQDRGNVQVSKADPVAPSKNKKGKPRGRPPKNRAAESTGAASASASASDWTEPAPPAVQAEETQEEQREPEAPEPWRVIVDEELMKIHSFPHFFHGNYCISQDIQWAADKNITDEAKDSINVIEVSGPWQWLGLDLRGPLPLTSSGQRFLLTLLDYSSKWIEAWPVESERPRDTVGPLLEALRHFGFPLRILSRLPRDTVHEMNELLKAELKVEFPLVVHHRSTGSVDPPTQQVIDRMVQELIEEHPSDWDVFVQAKVFSLCCKENPSTGQRPFSLLCCGGTAPEHTPRGQQLEELDLKDCEFVLR